ncbi:hypothetical protein BH582_00535 [Vibrio sp. 10N.222.47.A9]|uniref:site-specific integrase n=1 Tax=Vibrio TaxID=662 RepID=UPI000977280F|nr:MULTISPECIES: site-specific integrase [Vibrio]OMO34619.1 hypothetical protein BH582_00535 [Vibrio sp. 10N.222.47.A9]PTO65181.1 hypothetical protein CWN81_22795 [Vibrio splendidus]
MKTSFVSKQVKTALSVHDLKSQIGFAKLRSEKEKEELTLAQEISQFLEREKKKHKSRKHMRSLEYSLELLKELSNAGSIKDIDFQCAEDLTQALFLFPARRNQQPKLEKLQGYEAIVATLEHGLDTIEKSTVLGIVQRWSSFGKYCVKREFTKTNVFSGLISKSEVTYNKRHPFSDEQLSKIFAMQDYANHKYLHPYYYWIPLLLRFTGARLNELCTLYTSSIVNVDSIPCLVINDTLEAQRIKNRNSVRLIPIHHRLIDLGFLKFVNSLEDGLIFKELKEVNGYLSHNVSKWFSRRRQKLELKKGFDCYSFRHRFITELRERDVSFPCIMSLAGHLSNDEEKDLDQWLNSHTNRSYSHPMSPRVTQPIIESIDCSHTKHLRPFS